MRQLSRTSGLLSKFRSNEPGHTAYFSAAGDTGDTFGETYHINQNMYASYTMTSIQTTKCINHTHTDTHTHTIDTHTHLRAETHGSRTITPWND
jgi:hypothetical protein